MNPTNSNNIIFGPVPSRRLGRSLGINNIPAKVCSYSCLYCQVGKTDSMTIQRKEFYSPQDIFNRVKSKLKQSSLKNERVDYISFVPDGEPTLDVNLGTTIDLLKSLDVAIAVITNSSLINRHDVQNDLKLADWISIKVDSTENSIWHVINRPHGKLMLQKILDGLLHFRKHYQGKLVTETMLVKHINDRFKEIKRTVTFLEKLQPDIAYLALPIRPPADTIVEPADSNSVNIAYQRLQKVVKHAELLSDYDSGPFSSLGNVHDDLLSITSVHPMRMDAVLNFINTYGQNKSLLDEMLAKGEVVKSTYQGHDYMLRNVKNQH